MFFSYKNTFKLFFLLKIPIKNNDVFSFCYRCVVRTLALSLLGGAEVVSASEAVAHGGGLGSLRGHHNRKTGSYHRHQHRGGASCSSGRRTEVRSLEAGEGAVEEIFGRAERIIDGDTFWLARQDENVVKKVRLWGVDSPELRQGCVAEGEIWRCGEQARAKLRSMVAGETRFVVSCAEGVMIALWVVVLWGWRMLGRR